MMSGIKAPGWRPGTCYSWDCGGTEIAARTEVENSGRNGTRSRVRFRGGEGW